MFSFLKKKEKKAILNNVLSTFFSTKEDQQKSIFIKSERGGFKLKENVQFHLYISTSPCGDARIFSPHEAAQEGMIFFLDKGSYSGLKLFITN